MTTRRLSLNRFEGRDEQIAVLTLDEERDLLLPRPLLPPGTRAGEVLALAFEPESRPDGPGTATGLDINTAPPDALKSLPGIGPVLAERIVAGRPYRTVEDVAKVEGIGRATFERFRDRIVVAGPRTGQEASDPHTATVRLRIDDYGGPDRNATLVAGDDRRIDVPRDLLPGDVETGGVIQLTITRDLEATRQTKERIRSLQEELEARDPGGDITI